MTKKNWLDEPKMPVHPIRWQCLSCWREGRHEKPQTLSEAIRDHRSQNIEDIKAAELTRLVVPGSCSGDLRIIDDSGPVKRIKREPSPGIEFPDEGAILLS